METLIWQVLALWKMSLPRGVSHENITLKGVPSEVLFESIQFSMLCPRIWNRIFSMNIYAGHIASIWIVQPRKHWATHFQDQEKYNLAKSSKKLRGNKWTSLHVLLFVVKLGTSYVEQSKSRFSEPAWNNFHLHFPLEAISWYSTLDLITASANPQATSCLQVRSLNSIEEIAKWKTKKF